MKNINIASCFSGGFGTLNLALKYEKIEHKDIFAVEWMKTQRESYKLNYGLPTNGFFKDICDFDGKKFKGKIDLLHLSPPCTSFSLAGKQKGLDSETGDLMFETIRVIDEVQPKIFIIENVANMRTINSGDDFREIMRAIHQLEYSTHHSTMNAKEYGAIQNRDRIFIIGFRADDVSFQFPKKIERKYKLADFLEDDVDEKYYLNSKMIEYFQTRKQKGFKFEPMKKTAEYSKSLIARYAKMGATDPYIKEDLKQVGNIDTKGHNSLWGRVYDPDAIASNQNANGGGCGAKTGLYEVESKVQWFVYPHGVNKGGWRDVLVVPSVTTSSWNHNNFINSKSRIRRLSPRECARVMGDFEDLFKFGDFSDTKLYEFIGNAIEINVYRELLRVVLKKLDIINFRDTREPSFRKIEQTTLF